MIWLLDAHKYTSYLPVELRDPDGKVELVPEPVQGVLCLPQVDRVGPQVTLVILGYCDCYTISNTAYIDVKKVKYMGKIS
jgi:hypothetical protein